MKDRIGNEVNVGDFIVYATKTESPSLQFGWVLDVVEETKQGWNNSEYKTVKFKVHHAEANGKGINKQRWVMGEYDAFDNQITAPYYEDTGRPSTVWLNSTSRSNDNRLMVIQPV